MRASSRIAALALLALAGAAEAQSPGFSLEQILDFPFPSGVAAAPRGGRAAWISLHRGARSVYLADLAAARATRVAHFPRDDGQDLSSLVFSADGSSLAFVRGQGLNAQRQSPNPTSDPRGAEQAVWVAARGSAARRIGAGTSPELSPDGRRVVWQLDSTLMIAATAPGGAAPRPLFVGRGVNTDPQWSPDGRLVAFTSQRGDHSYVGVYDVARDSIRWMAPGVDRDASPRWSPDGRRLAFIRMSGGSAGGNVFAPRAGDGFALMIADPATGAARELWRSKPGVEGRLRVPTTGEYFLWSGSRLVFFTEADGWQHLYSIAGDGSQAEPAQLTRGECEVEEPSPTADGSTLYFSSNCGDPAAGAAGALASIDRKHIWRVAAGGGSAPVQVTSGTGIEYAPAVSGDRVLFLRSTATLPPRPVVRTAAGRELALAGAPALPAGFPTALVEPRQVTFTAADGMLIHGQLFLPPNAARAPAVVFMHGGPMRQMLLGFNPRGYYTRAYAFNQYLASRGVVVLAVNYRLGVGYGRAFREAPRGGRQGASEYQDIVAAGNYLRSLPAVDPERIGLWGGSYGGFLTAMGMAKNPELFRAGVDLHGVHDWNARFSSFAPATVAGRAEADSILAVGRASSPVCCVSSIRGPILFIHGDDDRNV
ncbi:MAG TPA: prolyl oligopeptidase family serine peptidase, partial [Gemmatimonadaceae bacterium]|nr:prolyl oligopeptidase family serine peptidase [Gemmatimonadaceae bacterium]